MRVGGRLRGSEQLAFASPPLAKGATGDLLLILLSGKQEQIPLSPPFSKGEAKAES